MNELINLKFGSYVDSPSRFVEDDHVRIPLEPFGQYDLLLVASGQGSRKLSVARYLYPHPLDVPLEGITFTGGTDEKTG